MKNILKMSFRGRCQNWQSQQTGCPIQRLTESKTESNNSDLQHMVVELEKIRNEAIFPDMSVQFKLVPSIKSKRFSKGDTLSK